MEISNLLKSFRLSVSIPVAYLVHIGAILAHSPTNWYLVLEVFFITGLTMMQNDFVDRVHDRKKGKTFAFLHANMFFMILIIGWFCVTACALLFFEKEFWLLVCIIGCGIGYSWMRKILLLPLLTVAVLSASPVIVGAYTALSGNVWIFFAVVFFGILGREICKDIEDKSLDVGYKKTLLSTGLLSLEKACMFVVCALGVSVLFSLFLMPRENLARALYIGFSIEVVACAFVLLVFKHPVKNGIKCIDYGMILLLIALSI